MTVAHAMTVLIRHRVHQRYGTEKCGCSLTELNKAKLVISRAEAT